MYKKSQQLLPFEKMQLDPLSDKKKLSTIATMRKPEENEEN